MPSTVVCEPGEMRVGAKYLTLLQLTRPLTTFLRSQMVTSQNSLYEADEV
jgi:hypothetical protein